MVLGDELQLVSVDDGEIERILVRARHFEHLVFTEVDDDRSLGTGGPMANCLGQLDDVDLLDFPFCGSHALEAKAAKT